MINPSKGFTLLQVLVATLILGVVSVLVVDSLTQITKNQKKLTIDSTSNGFESLILNLIQNRKTCTEALKDKIFTSCSTGTSCTSLNLTSLSFHGGSTIFSDDQWVGFKFLPTSGLSTNEVQSSGQVKIDHIELIGHGDFPEQTLTGHDGHTYKSTLASLNISFKSAANTSVPDSQTPSPISVLFHLTYDTSHKIVACGIGENENVSELRTCSYSQNSGGNSGWLSCPHRKQILIGCTGGSNQLLEPTDNEDSGFIGVGPNVMSGSRPTACRATADTDSNVSATVWIYCLTDEPSC